jgi:uncharacterized protein
MNDAFAGADRFFRMAMSRRIPGLRIPGLLLAACLMLLCVRPALAFDPPAFQGDVLDEAGVLVEAQRSLLKERIRALREGDGIWAAVYVANSLQGDSIENAAVLTFEKWKLGKAGKDNGVLVMVVPAERKMRIEVGYGLEGSITDALSIRVIAEVYRPAFRDNRFTEGLLEGFDVMAKAVRGEKALPDAPPVPAGSAPAQVDIDGGDFLTRFSLVLGINLAFPLSFLAARRYGRSKGRTLGEASDPSPKTMLGLFTFFGLVFGLFISVFGLAFPEDPEFVGFLVLANAVFVAAVAVPYGRRVRAYVSASAYRRWQARERLLRIRTRSSATRKIFGVWFEPAEVSNSRGGTRHDSSDSSSSWSSSDSSSSSGSSSSGGGRSGGGGASGSW